jgi:hypothetical protein
LLKSFIANLKYEPLLEPVIWAKAQQLLVHVPCLAKRLSSSLPEISNLNMRAKVLDGGKYLERKASDIWVHVLIVPVSKDLNQFLTLSPKEKGNALSLMASDSIPLILTVLHNSSNMARYWFGSSWAKPLNMC